MPPFALERALAPAAVMADEDDYNHFERRAHRQGAADAGVSVQLGAHGQREGLAAHWELWMLVQGGMTPHAGAARRHPRRARATSGSTATSARSSRASSPTSFVVDGNPLEDIRQSDRVRYTMVNGRLYDARTMDELWPQQRKRSRRYWEQ